MEDGTESEKRTVEIPKNWAETEYDEMERRERERERRIGGGISSVMAHAPNVCVRVFPSGVNVFARHNRLACQAGS